ncbi:unnamed protein product, partial [Effrenium voratum]
WLQPASHSHQTVHQVPSQDRRMGATQSENRMQQSPRGGEGSPESEGFAAVGREEIGAWPAPDPQKDHTKAVGQPPSRGFESKPSPANIPEKHGYEDKAVSIATGHTEAEQPPSRGFESKPSPANIPEKHGYEDKAVSIATGHTEAEQPPSRGFESKPSPANIPEKHGYEDKAVSIATAAAVAAPAPKPPPPAVRFFGAAMDVRPPQSKGTSTAWR